MSGYHDFSVSFSYTMYFFLVSFFFTLLSTCHQFYDQLHSACSSSLFLFCSHNLNLILQVCFFLLLFDNTEETCMNEVTSVGFTNTVCWRIIKPQSCESAFFVAIYVSNNRATASIQSMYLCLSVCLSVSQPATQLARFMVISIFWPRLHKIRFEGVLGMLNLILQ